MAGVAPCLSDDVRAGSRIVSEPPAGRQRVRTGASATSGGAGVRSRAERSPDRAIQHESPFDPLHEAILTLDKRRTSARTAIAERIAPTGARDTSQVAATTPARQDAPMDRPTWLAERKAALITAYDDEAATYDADPYPASLHGAWVDRLVATVPEGGLVLDAPCGTGRWFARVVDAGRRVVGVDQSPGMLAQAERTGLAAWTQLGSLEELPFDGDFDAAMAIDGLENVSPEAWPQAARNLARAIKPGASLYVTLEEIDQRVIDAAYEHGLAEGWPVVHGEIVAGGDTAGYHHYPGRDRVIGWFEAAGLTLMDEAVDPPDDRSYRYRHVLLRRA
jgi:ubiquinone/menaquinone biosynthesis C-methylase UbiE